MPSIHIAASVAGNASTTAGALDDRGYVQANDALDSDAVDQGTAFSAATIGDLSPDTGPMVGGTQCLDHGDQLLQPVLGERRVGNGERGLWRHPPFERLLHRHEPHYDHPLHAKRNLGGGR
jgi:hypothetical protein